MHTVMHPMPHFNAFKTIIVLTFATRLTYVEHEATGKASLLSMIKHLLESNHLGMYLNLCKGVIDYRGGSLITWGFPLPIQGSPWPVL